MRPPRATFLDHSRPFPPSLPYNNISPPSSSPSPSRPHILSSSSAFSRPAMLLKAPPRLALLSPSSSDPSLSPGNPSLRSYLKLPNGRARAGPVFAAAGGDHAITGVIFEPFEELKSNQVSLVPVSPDQSLARQKYADDCEAAVNLQINVEYNVSYVYHALFAYFDRDNVALKGLAKFFRESSQEERDHAEKLMKYQNKRGGRVKLLPIVMPLTEFDHPTKGDALYAMELALSLEKLTNEKLLDLHCVAQKHNDAQMADFIESEFLAEQVEAIKKISEYVAQLRRVGKGHGVWHFDQMLLHEGDAA